MTATRAVHSRLRPPAGLAAVSLLAALALSGCGGKTAGPAAPTKDFEVQAALSTNRVPIGAEARLELRVYHPLGAAVTVPELDRPKEIVVRKRDRRTEAHDADTQLTRFDYTLASYRLGEHLVSTGMVRLTGLDGAVREEPFPPLRLDVRSVREQGDTALRDALEPATLPSPWRRRWKWLVAGALLIIAAAALLAWALRRYKPKPPPAVPPALPNAHLLALKSLQELRARRLIEAGRIGEFTVAVSGILRIYLERRFQLDAPERTTEEFIAEASRSRALTLDQQAAVREFLELCDLVKFARFTPDAAQGEGLLQSAERFVRETAARPGAPS